MKLRWHTRYRASAKYSNMGGYIPRELEKMQILQVWNKKKQIWEDVPTVGDEASLQKARRELLGVRSPKVIPVKSKNEKKAKA